MLEIQNIGFRIVSLSATPVSKIENLQAIVSSLRVAMFEVRDEEDDEIRQYTHDKNIVEIVVEKENHICEMENKIYKIMALALMFLKQVKIVPHAMQPKFLNKMNVLQMQDTFRSQMSNYAPSMISCVFERISCLLSLCHAKKLLLTHGVESFSDYILNFFDLSKKDKGKGIGFLKDLK
jgi:ERCC4-related helicase